MLDPVAYVIRVGVTPGRQMTLSPYFLLKKLTSFFVIALCKVMTFLAVVSSQLPPSDVVYPVFFFLNSRTNICCFILVSPPDGVTRGGPPPSNATG